MQRRTIRLPRRSLAAALSSRSVAFAALPAAAATQQELEAQLAALAK